MNDNLKGQSFSSLPRPQKTAVIILSVVAVGIFAVWIGQFNMRLSKPFLPSPEEMAAGKKAAQEQLALEIANKTKDSDNDGLLDVDEVSIYKTSPYLEDTDGDNISDLDEIRLGKDPLCAEGTDCTSVSVPNQTQNTTTVPAITDNNNPADNIDQELLTKALNGEGTADIMRQILLQAGGDPAQIKLLTDADLMSLYKDVLQSQSNTATSTTAATSSIINK